MSRWLSQVNSLLEKLDGTVEDAIEEQAVQRDESYHGEGKDAIESILAKRGMSVMEEENKVESIKLPVDTVDHDEQSEILEPVKNEIAELDVGRLPITVGRPLSEATLATTKLPETILEEIRTQNNDEGSIIMDPIIYADKPERETNVSKEAKKSEREMISTQHQAETKGDKKLLEIPASPVAKSITKNTPPPSPTRPGHSFENEYKAALTDAREAQKEARTLRRHVVALNSELESVEAENKAQSSELERAGDRMDKDRTRAKDEKERLMARHAEEIKLLKKHNEQVVDDLKTRNETILEEARNQLRVVEQRRKEEGGDWNKELLGAIEREQETQKRMLMLEDEKSILLSQINMLQSNSEGLGNRLEAMSQAADNAMLREREAEDKLDAALSVHARQLSQRQAREGELERTIADLGAALVAARSKGGEKSSASVDGADDAVSTTPHKIRAQFDQFEDDLETVKNQLEHERQQSKKLLEELKDMSRERADEAASFRAKQIQYDRQLADMSVTISRLQSNVREAKRDTIQENLHVDLGDDVNLSQINSLSEELMRLQEKCGQYGSELSALRSRLKVAVDRAEQAEDALATVEAEVSESQHDLEGGPSSGASSGMRRRGGNRNRRSHENGGSIRAAFRLNNPQNQQVETVGKAIDALDTFSVQTGKFLRANPIARGGFLLYLIILHFWTFLVLFFHAHNYEPVHGDFGAGQQLAHGPNALIQQHALIRQQQLTNIVAPVTSLDTKEIKIPPRNFTKSQSDVDDRREVIEISDRSNPIKDIEPDGGIIDNPSEKVLKVVGKEASFESKKREIIRV